MRVAADLVSLGSTYLVDGVVHYCVANMPGAVPRTSTFALPSACDASTVLIGRMSTARGVDRSARGERDARRNYEWSFRTARLMRPTVVRPGSPLSANIFVCEHGCFVWCYFMQETSPDSAARAAS
jgi:hypothetical protein